MEEHAFMAQASHDIKSLLTSVKAYVQLLQRQLSKTQNEKAMLYAGKIEWQIDRVTKMLSDLVDIYRIKAGKLELYKECWDIDQCISEIVEQMQITTTTHTISLEGKAMVSVAFDKTRVSQAVRNIVHNAIMYSPGNTEIFVRIRKTADEVIVLVEDKGKGITEEKISSIFDPFLNEGPQGVPGLGAGLFIASSIIKAHGGEISIQSEEGKGTSISIKLPISPQ